MLELVLELFLSSTQTPLNVNHAFQCALIGSINLLFSRSLLLLLGNLHLVRLISQPGREKFFKPLLGGDDELKTALSIRLNLLKLLRPFVQ